MRMSSEGLSVPGGFGAAPMKLSITSAANSFSSSKSVTSANTSSGVWLNMLTVFKINTFQLKNPGEGAPARCLGILQTVGNRISTIARPQLPDGIQRACARPCREPNRLRAAYE